MSAFQILEDARKSKGSDFEPIPVVSSTIGETGSSKQFANHYEWFDRFDKIIVCPDMDDAGQAAVKELVKVLPKGKMSVMSLPMKDTNAMLEAGKAKQWIDCFWKARPYTPDGIVGSGALSSKIREYAAIKKIPLPPFMHKVQSLMAGGIPLGVILCLGSSSGSGKSTFTDEMLYYWIFNSPHKVGIISMESDSGAYATKLLSRHIGRKIDLIPDEDEKLRFLNSQEVLDAERTLFSDERGEDRFFLIEDRDSGWEAMKNSIMNLIVSCEVKVIVLDPLQDAWAGMTLEQQEKASAWLKGSVKSHGVTYILINHVRKSSQGSKSNSQGADLTEEDFHGSSSIFKSSACNLLFMRNKEDEDEIARNTTVMKMTKCRWSGQTSPFAGKFYYDNATHCLHDFDDWAARNNRGF
jgi:KaiC/GvpD/RAD55 family RecA-like ATPase